jgi:hypothetical protein
VIWQPRSAYAQAALRCEQRARQAVGETFDILWLTWDEVAASPDAVRHARMLLAARAGPLPHPRRPIRRHGLSAVAFSTALLAQALGLVECLARIDAFTRFLDAITSLPADRTALGQSRGPDAADDGAARSLAALCRAVVSHCFADQRSDFRTDRMPKTRTARIVAESVARDRRHRHSLLAAVHRGRRGQRASMLRVKAAATIALRGVLLGSAAANSAVVAWR